MRSIAVQPYDMIIVGAGISGLTMAHYCVKDRLRTLVLEKGQRVGGSLHSVRFDGPAAGFWLELGAHSCFNSYRQLIGILEERALLGRLVPREKVSFKLLVDGMLKSVPSQLRYLELLASLPRLLTQRKSGQSVAEYYAKIVGRRNFERVFSPAFDAVICQSAADFPAELLFRPKPRRKDVIRSFSLPNGLQSIAESLADESGVEVRTGQEVRAISCGDDLFTLTTTAGERYSAHCLTLAIPVSVAAMLLAESFPELSALLSRVQTVNLESVGIAVPRERVRLPAVAGLIARDDVFFSVVSRDTMAHPAYRGFTFHFKPARLDLDAQRTRIATVLGISPDQLPAVVNTTNYLPSLTVGHAERMRAVDESLVATRLALTGNYFTGVSIEDCVSRSLAEYTRLRSAGLGQPLPAH